MLRPEPMKRVLVIASKDRQEQLIDALHSMGVAHLVDYREGGIEGFGIGKPLPAASAASEKIVRLRSVARQLGVKPVPTPGKTFTTTDISHRLAPALTEIELNATSAVEARDRLVQALSEITQEETRLKPLASLPLALEDYRGYNSLAVLVGTAQPAFKEAVAAAAPDHLLFASEGEAFALFVPKDRAAAVQEALLKNGFKSLEVPQGTGAPAARLERIAHEKDDLSKKLEAQESALKHLASQYGDFILAADEDLSISTEKAEAPLSFASTENAFVVDAWVPVSKFHWMSTKLNQVTHGAVHIEAVAEPAAPLGRGERRRSPTEVRAEAHEHEPLGHGHAEEEAPKEEPPTKYRNPKAARPFEFFIDLFSKPKHDEIDPTIIVAFVFPLFFGFMIGDLGYGVLMMLIGYTLLTKLKDIEGLPQLGAAIFAAGVVAAIFGGFVFKEAFGIPFAASHHALEELGHAGAAATCANLQSHLKETTWACLGSLGANTGLDDPFVGKLTNVTDLLVLSVIAGFVHIGLGLLFGIVNTLGHGWKHLGAKVSWVFIFVGFLGLIMSMSAPLLPAESFLALPVALLGSIHPASLYLLLPGVLGLLVTEGPIGVLEVPALLSNMISYTRLAGVAVAKGAMAFAFNSLFLVGMVLAPGSGIEWIIIAVIGFVLLIVTQLMVFVLGILASGIQAIRLNYVEFFLKFYAGGGRDYAPFGRERQYSTG